MLPKWIKLVSIMQNKNSKKDKVYKDEIKNLLAEFFNYMKDHFYEEERYMELIKYPDIENIKNHKQYPTMIELIKILNHNDKRKTLLGKNGF
nr:hypothetical protein [Campylobacter jejuni]